MFVAKHFAQTLLKFDGVNQCRGENKEKRKRYGKMNGDHIYENSISFIMVDKLIEDDEVVFELE